MRKHKMICENGKYHPLFTLLNTRPTLPITSLMVTNVWDDDHLFCFDIKCEVDGKVFEYSDMWVHADPRMYLQAEISQVKRDKVRSHILFLGE